MDFREAANRLAVNTSDDLDMELGAIDTQDLHAAPGTSSPSTDGLDPAAPGGPAPYNGADPFGQPATSNPEWLDPSQHEDRRGHNVPYTPGPTQNITTLHNARRALYAAQEKRTR